jgi:hypothetical protein
MGSNNMASLPARQDRCEIGPQQAPMPIENEPTNFLRARAREAGEFAVK